MPKKKYKTQAEKAAASRKTTTKTSNAPAKKNTAPNKNSAGQKTEIPVRVITSISFITAFLIFLIVTIIPEGAVIKLLADLVRGLIGQVAFIVFIPVLLYLFVIHAFSGNKPVTMRTICLFSFTILVGCITHLTYNPQNLQNTNSVVSELYLGGISGTTGGLISGGLAMLIKPLLGSVITYVLFVVAAIVTLLASMQITIPSIVRAVKNRPKSDIDEMKPEREDPATVLVNHFANKRIERIERRRTIAQQYEEDDEEEDKEETETEPEFIATRSNKSKIPPVDSLENMSRADQIMRQIDADVDVPVSASANTYPAEEDPELLPAVQPRKPIPVDMPPFDADAPLTEALDLEEQIEEKAAKKPAKEMDISVDEISKEIEETAQVVKKEYIYPPMDLLKLPSGGAADGTAEMRDNTRRLNETLASFKIEAHIINVTRGPSVTRYEVELEKGVRLNKLTTAADDIALSLGASGVRIAAIPGKISVVGIEVPNRAVTTVSLREVIDSQEFSKAKSKSSFAVGKDIGGNCIVGNIAKLPHMLIAGTTGSGKSVCMNSIIVSLLYKATPEEVKLIMIDPKMVELGIYNEIPHLLVPVVTDPKKAAGSLQWAVVEMMRRYKAMSDAGVRDLESYNSIIESHEAEGQKMPQVVVIIDELADLMLVAAKEVEESICRIAQMGRAAGIHLIIATQRPSADVITGLMKANIPSRIAFSVASAMESRIILDTPGAEKLVGRGDMLYAPIGNGKPKRVQGCFLSDSEVEAVANYVKSNFKTTYDQSVMEEIEKKAAQTGNSKAAVADVEPSSEEMDGDEMLPAAVDVILETGQASVSMLQRRLKLGYARAARIVDEMEEKGIVGPFMGSKPRTILITKDQWASMRSGSNSQMGFDDLEDSDED